MSYDNIPHRRNPRLQAPPEEPDLDATPEEQEILGQVMEGIRSTDTREADRWSTNAVLELIRQARDGEMRAQVAVPAPDIPIPTPTALDQALAIQRVSRELDAFLDNNGGPRYTAQLIERMLFSGVVGTNFLRLYLRAGPILFIGYDWGSLWIRSDEVIEEICIRTSRGRKYGLIRGVDLQRARGQPVTYLLDPLRLDVPQGEERDWTMDVEVISNSGQSVQLDIRPLIYQRLVPGGQ